MIRHLKTLLRTLDILLFGYPGWNLIHFTFPLQRADKEKAVAAVIVADLTDCPRLSSLSHPFPVVVAAVTQTQWRSLCETPSSLK